MAYAVLLLHMALCAAVVVLSFSIRRGVLNLRTLRPGGEREDLGALRRSARGLAWKAPMVTASLVAVVIVGALWSPVWRTSAIGRGVLTALSILAGINLLIALAKGHHQQWSPRGSWSGLLASGLWAGVAFGLCMLTLFWRFGA